MSGWKTLIANALVIALALLGMPEFLGFFPALDAETVVVIVAVMNMALRLLTRGPDGLTTMLSRDRRDDGTGFEL